MWPWTIYAILALLIVSCGVRNANPVALTQPSDNSKDCNAIVDEMKSNDNQIRQLMKDADAVDTKNVVGLFILPWVLIDFSDAERIQVNALSDRNRHLHKMQQERCLDPKS